MINPCQFCGACCATFRVDFHPAELAGGNYAWGAGISPTMVHSVTPNIVRMVGTDANPPRCIGLAGEIGQSVTCTLYDVRPSPCREFDVEHDACAKARQKHGLPPLQLDQAG